MAAGERETAGVALKAGAEAGITKAAAVDRIAAPEGAAAEAETVAMVAAAVEGGM